MHVGFLRPTTVEEAVAALAADEDARLLAGGQTLMATIATGLYRPSATISLAGVAELRGLRRLDDGTVRMGAMATHAEIAASPLFAGAQRLVPDAAGRIAYPAIRNAGTVGGACAHGDPASDWPAIAVAADARLHLAGPSGHRTVAAADFFVDFLTTALDPGEMIVAIDVPPRLRSFAVERIVRVAGDYATLSVLVALDHDGGLCRSVRIAVGSCGVRPLRDAGAEGLLIGRTVDRDTALAAGDRLAAMADPVGDVRASAAYRRRVMPALVSRAILGAMSA
jgi:aerobic carbon-monoxide dehydrogenase medium subunit